MLADWLRIWSDTRSFVNRFTTDPVNADPVNEETPS